MRLLRPAILAILAIVPCAQAQDGPLRILVGFPAGGGADLVARLAADKMRETLGVPVIVDNKPGAGGQIAALELKNAPADGRTLMAAPVAVTVIAPLTHRKLAYDPFKDFAPVSLAVNFQLALTTGPMTGAGSLAEFIAWLKANPTKANFGVPAAGSLPHFFALLFARAVGADMQTIPYKGGAPLLNDLAGGQVPAGVDVLAEAIKLHQAGKVRILASSGTQRSPVSPDIPTFTELGFPQIQGNGWFAFHAPAATPAPMIERLSAAASGAIRTPETSDRLTKIGFEPVGSTALELSQRMQADRARWEPIVKASGFTADQ